MTCLGEEKHFETTRYIMDICDEFRDNNVRVKLYNKTKKNYFMIYIHVEDGFANVLLEKGVNIRVGAKLTKNDSEKVIRVIRSHNAQNISIVLNGILNKIVNKIDDNLQKTEAKMDSITPNTKFKSGKGVIVYQ